MRNPIIVALDVPDIERARQLVRDLAPVVGAFKVGKELFVAAGPDVVRALGGLGFEVFLDLKFHDIPNTVAKAVSSAVRLDVQMLTVHTAGGHEMLAAAEEAAQRTAAQQGTEPPLVLGVTVLTSMDNENLVETGVESTVAQQVERLAMLAAKCGLRGLVCSPLEIALLRQVIPSNMQLVTPGIRPDGGGGDDQKRTLTPREAVEAGGDWLVIGRPIYQAENPRKAAEEIMASLK
ncbi:MAG TPA: orotidine-5'-phosphate decarboxylase [Verrucomicrobiales bacterium]|nr:orotidine-5'-phosphate decarboxylase [Verrucomicrobiales bacterium]